jgi:hypothetical protein
MTIKATVKAGRLVIDEPTNLPDGTEVELLPLDPGDCWMMPIAPLSTRRFVTRMLTSLPVGSSTLRKFSGNSDRVDAAPRSIHEHRARTRQAREGLVA